MSSFAVLVSRICFAQRRLKVGRLMDGPLVAARQDQRPSSGNGPDSQTVAVPPAYPPPAAKPTQHGPKGPHIATLDALRGVAAIAVVLHHIGVEASHCRVADPLHSWFTHGYLAVDFFFVLSGFVISKAYEARLRADLGPWRYMIIRAKRLYPVIAVGTLLGLFGAILCNNNINLWLAFAAQLFFVPFVTSQITFVLNVVQWSLAFELAINAVHAASLRHLTTPRLVALVGVSLFALGAAAFYYHTLGVGWALHNAPGGFARISFGFFAGVLVQRVLTHLPVPQVSIVWIGLCIATLLALPIPPWRSAGYDLIVAALFPLLVAVSARASIPKALAGSCIIMGRLSYPLYALHVPILAVTATALAARGMRGTDFLIPMLGAAGAAMALSAVVDRFLDAPLQSALRLPRGERPSVAIIPAASAVSIRAPARGATTLPGCSRAACEFRSALPRGERHAMRDVGVDYDRFRSALPRGERPHSHGTCGPR